jgi:sugar lactone lactonase YvrE
MNNPERVLSVNNPLGEGPVWHPTEQALYWCAIDSDRFYRWQPGVEGIETTTIPHQIGCLGFHEAGGYVLATNAGFARYQGGQYTLLTDNIAHQPPAAFNDGAVDRAGRMWAGTANEKPENYLYRLDVDGTVAIMERGVSISNGIGWSPDSTIMYYADSGAEGIGIIYAYDFDLAAGTISNRRDFFRSDKTHGLPDGLTVDAEGGVWCAFWDGSKVMHFSPDGRIIEEVRLPVPRVTSCCFGGPSLDDLYITTAQWDLDLAMYPMAGDVFRVKTAVCGLPEPMAKLGLP